MDEQIMSWAISRPEVEPSLGFLLLQLRSSVAHLWLLFTGLASGGEVWCFSVGCRTTWSAVRGWQKHPGAYHCPILLPGSTGKQTSKMCIIYIHKRQEKLLVQLYAKGRTYSKFAFNLRTKKIPFKGLIFFLWMESHPEICIYLCWIRNVRKGTHGFFILFQRKRKTLIVLFLNF